MASAKKKPKKAPKGSTVHVPGCTCGFCKNLQFTKGA